MSLLLICSQSPFLRRNLAAACKSLTRLIVEVDSSISLVSACLTQEVNLVILDSDLEFLSTPLAIRCLRCTPATRHVPILALANNPAELQGLLEAGADRVLLKPIETAKLLRMAQQLGRYYTEATAL